jgi:hypothetical protein
MGSRYRVRSNRIRHRLPARDSHRQGCRPRATGFVGARVHADSFIEPDRHVACVAEDGARWLRDFGGRKRRSGHLIQQRLKKVMIAPVNQDDVGLCIEFTWISSGSGALGRLYPRGR